MNIYLVIFITLVAALVASFSQILYKKGLKKKISSLRSMFTDIANKYVMYGLSGYIISLVIYLYALSAAPLSVVYPVFASTFIFITILSSLLLKEKLSGLRVVGMALIFIGIAIISTSI